MRTLTFAVRTRDRYEKNLEKVRMMFSELNVDPNVLLAPEKSQNSLSSLMLVQKLLFSLLVLVLTIIFSISISRHKIRFFLHLILFKFTYFLSLRWVKQYRIQSTEFKLPLEKAKKLLAQKYFGANNRRL
ncbi:MAG: hypothetical protein O9301_06445 [Leptospira sp.]|nr:hypothetical protein [Leptospira sp.]